MSKANPDRKDPEKATDKEKDIWREERGAGEIVQKPNPEHHSSHDTDVNLDHGKRDMGAQFGRDKGHGIGDPMKPGGGGTGKPAGLPSASKMM